VASPISVMDSDGRVGREDGVAGRHGVELGEDRLLDLHALGHGLHDEVHVAEAVIGGGAMDAAEDLLDVGRGLLRGQPALLGELARRAGGDAARLGQAGVDQVLPEVLEDDGDAGGGDRLRDLAAHGPGADDGCLEDEHCGGSPGWGSR
jgi:hypothetical protein